MMNILDMRTVFIGFSISNAICAVVMAFLWSQNRRRFPALSFWLANFILQFFAVFLVALRDMIPDFLSIVVANTLGVGGLILLYVGLQRFANQAGSRVHHYVLLAAFVLVHTYFTYLQPSLAARNHNYSITVIIISIQIAWFTLRRMDAKFRPYTSNIGTIFVVFSLVNVVRFLVGSNSPETNDLFQSGFLETLIVLFFQMLYIGLTFTLFLLINQCLVGELEVDIAKRKRMELSLQHRLVELETVNRFSTSLRAGRNLEELLQILLKETLQAVTTADGCILLLDPSGSALQRAAAKGWFETLPELSFDPTKGIVGHVLTANESHISLDLPSDLSRSNPGIGCIPTQSSGALLPVYGDKGAIGMLIVSFSLPRLIRENELRLLAIIAQLAANAISRCRLNDQVKLSNIDLQKEVEQKIIAQELLAAEKELLSTTLMSIADGVIATDGHGRVILFNPAAETITGFTVSEAIKEPINCVFQLQDTTTLEPVPDVIDYLLKLESDQNRGVSYRSPQVMTKTGDRILVSGSITPLNSAEEAAGFVIVFQNVNEKQKAEAQKVLSQKMEAIGQLAAGIAHEINTPIQYIGDNVKFIGKAFSKYSETLIAYKQMIQERLDQTITHADWDQLETQASYKKTTYYLAEIPKAIQESLDGIERVRRIVLAMREFSHPSEKEKKFSDINHGIETTTVISRNEWKYCAEMELNLDEELPLVYCQIDEINQVILNMIVNAAQAIQENVPPGSEHKGKISIGTRRQESSVLITVQDTGSGISPEIRARVFDPFFTTKGVGKGTGQGLSMAHNIIVKKHHGTITVDSEPGQGTTFTIQLPADSSEWEQP